jgi:hypothetical protein
MQNYMREGGEAVNIMQTIGFLCLIFSVSWWLLSGIVKKQRQGLSVLRLVGFYSLTVPFYFLVTSWVVGGVVGLINFGWKHVAK